ncbi:MAG TPA: ABC transporter ATP-binding protein [Propionibacteriaceae bacterium]|nr:ABC transporter ATP-binding protein [Propionibacteriaceae bacterium]
MTESSPSLVRVQTADPPAVVLAGVRRSYGKGNDTFEAVRGVDLTVWPGQIYALLGTNGAGKTSTVELVEGLAQPSAGAIKVFGLDPVKDRQAVRARTGVVLQSSGFPTTLTVGEMARMWHGTLTRPRAVEGVLADVDLADKERVPTSSLSGGERRRLDIGLALMGQPDLLVLDEPTTGLDPESRQRIWRLVGDLREEDVAILLTTHYLEEAERLADHIAVMHRGVIAVEGTLDEIVATTPAQIRFRRPESLRVDQLAVTQAQVTHDKDDVVVATRTLQRTLAEVLQWAGDVQLASLSARSASLEQVFLDIADLEEIR